MKNCGAPPENALFSSVSAREQLHRIFTLRVIFCHGVLLPLFPCNPPYRDRTPEGKKFTCGVARPHTLRGASEHDR